MLCIQIKEFRNFKVGKRRYLTIWKLHLVLTFQINIELIIPPHGTPQPFPLTQFGKKFGDIANSNLHSRGWFHQKFSSGEGDLYQ